MPRCYTTLAPHHRHFDVINHSGAKICQKFAAAGKVVGKQQLSMEESAVMQIVSSHSIVLKQNAARCSSLLGSGEFCFGFPGVYSQWSVFTKSSKKRYTDRTPCTHGSNYLSSYQLSGEMPLES